MIDQWPMSYWVATFFRMSRATVRHEILKDELQKSQKSLECYSTYRPETK